MKKFHLPLLAALPALMASCSSPGGNVNDYQRNTYATYEQCLQANQKYIDQGMQNPCVRNQSSGGYYGPWFFFWGGGGAGRVVGYNNDGSASRSGYQVDRDGRLSGRFQAPRISRGGFSTGTRGSGGTGTGAGTGAGDATRSTAPGNSAGRSSTPPRITVPGSRGNRTGGSFGG
ncbi:hypothetical protein [Deinococcus sp. Marseille-Q6407]|uniref:hypothetical protein n=1 Tax=Deinococcus sp. Marseille-Q6407 TaxID=2969223 RepID=UPI0021C1F031|nr:hypothetical protein [Deinococcus sp. Marseille-Q6407]